MYFSIYLCSAQTYAHSSFAITQITPLKYHQYTDTSNVIITFTRTLWKDFIVDRDVDAQQHVLPRTSGCGDEETRR